MTMKIGPIVEPESKTTTEVSDLPPKLCASGATSQSQVSVIDLTRSADGLAYNQQIREFIAALLIGICLGQVCSH